MASRLRIAHRTAAVVAAAALALAGCGSGSSSTTPQNDQASANGELSGTLTVLHYYDEGAGALTPFVKTWEERFEKAHPKVDVQFEYVPYDQMQQKVISAASAGKGWDLIMPTAVWLPEMVKAGAVQSIDQQWDSFADKALFPDNTQSAGVLNDKRYAVQGYTNVEGIFYNKTILDELGVAVPKTLDEMEGAMEKAKSAGYTPFTTAAPNGAGGEFNAVPWLVSNGWSYDNPAAPGAKEILARLQKWRDAGYFSSNDASGFVAEKNFSTGKYAFAQGGNWNLGTFKDSLKFSWGAAVIPGIDKSLLGGEIIAMGSKAADPALAWQFVQETFLSKQGGLDAASAGSIPLRTDLKNEKVVTSDPNLVAFATIAAASIGNPINNNTGKISDVIGSSWNEFVAGTIGSDEAAQRIADGIPPLMSQ
jgi:ABC-type glycerol-3-phosphate transport system substrate-binding protein